MKIKELFQPGGRGVIATANAKGVVNMAIYAIPHIIDDKTVAWGMTEGRTYRNVKENPNAAYLYMNPGNGYTGTRLVLKLKEIVDSGEMLTEIKRHTAEIVSPHAAAAVHYVAYFEIAEKRPLI